MITVYRHASNEVSGDKFSSTSTAIDCPRCKFSVLWGKNIIFWRDNYWHMDCAFENVLEELEMLQSEAKDE